MLKLVSLWDWEFETMFCRWIDILTEWMVINSSNHLSQNGKQETIFFHNSALFISKPISGTFLVLLSFHDM